MKIEEFIKNDSRKYKGIPLFVFLFNKIFWSISLNNTKSPFIYLLFLFLITCSIYWRNQGSRNWCGILSTYHTNKHIKN